MRLPLALVVLASFAPPPASDPPLADFARTPAPIGAEKRFLDEIDALLPGGLWAEFDAFGSLLLRCGGGPEAAKAPVRLLIAVGVDEPGYVVSQIRPDGYLRVRAVGAPTPPGDFHLLREGRPARLWTRAGVRSGVMLVDSLHLRSTRPAVLGEEHMYLDVGADSAQDVAALGIELLDPVVQRELVALKDGSVAGPGIGRRTAALAMLRALRDVPEVRATPGLAFAFVAQSSVGAGPLGRGGEGAVRRLQPEELLVLRAAEIEAGTQRDERTEPAYETAWRTLTVCVRHAGTPVEQVAAADADELFRELLETVVYLGAREDSDAAAAEDTDAAAETRP